MDLAIRIIDVSGKSFLEDLSSGKHYYIDDVDSKIRSAQEEDFYPMNTQYE